MVLLSESFIVVSGSFQAVCLKFSSPNVCSEKKDGSKADKESSLELCPLVWQQSQARP